MLPKIRVDWNSESIGWYIVCVGEAKEVLAVYNNGVLQTITTEYTLDYSLTRAGKVYTVIKFATAYVPEETDVITCDVKGYEVTGNTGSGTTAPTGVQIINPVEQLRHLLLNFGEDNYQTGAWATYESSTFLDADSWSEAADWAASHLLEGAGYIGGGTEAVQLWHVVNEWLETWPMFRMYWTAAGTLGLRVIGLEFPGYRQVTDPPLLRSEHDLGGAEYNQDTNNLTDSITASFLWDEVQQKYLGTLAVIDPDAGSDIDSAVALKWSVRRAV